ncbi:MULTISPECIES: hypothetical protein [Bacillus]|uniref:hypothetical protein n=1 Tax=Bacillus TaxID=1386 RepID=UPI000C764BC6|nr:MULTISPECIES: hypothetical protein [Bacillus]MCP1161206.1 hypothetical protein [Bacillus infantis]PLR70533.1 hypothetical protein CYJ37_23660 [Bacillus sp. UMB0728]
MDEKNYHSRLLHISNNLDKVIEKLKASYIDQRLTMPWALWLAAAPLRDIAKVKELQQGLKSFITTGALMAILPLATAALGPWVLGFTELPWWATLFVTGVLGYFISMIYYFPQLTKFDSVHFHLGAYKTWRKQEYEIFRGAFLDSEGEFYFRGLYDYTTNSKTQYTMIQSLIQDFLSQERTEYKSKIYSLEQNIKQTLENTEQITAEYEKFTQDLISERDALLQEFEYVIYLLKDLNTLLFRFHNKGMELRDLNILTGFTLYELRGDTLYQLEDVGTSGLSAAKIPIKDKQFSHYGAVKVIKDDQGRPYFNHPYEGHVVVSYKIRIDNKATWVYNFHFDDSNTRAWKLLVENGIIESKEIYRLVHALCLLAQNDRFKDNKEAVNQ